MTNKLESSPSLNNEAEFTITLMNEDSIGSKSSDEFLQPGDSSYEISASKANKTEANLTSYGVVANPEYEKYINKVQINTNFAKSLDFEVSASSSMESPTLSMKHQQDGADLRSNQTEINSFCPEISDTISPRVSSLTMMSHSKKVTTDDSCQETSSTTKLNLYSYGLANSFKDKALLDKYSKKLMKVSMKVELRLFVREIVISCISDLQKEPSTKTPSPLSFELQNETYNIDEKQFDDVLVIESDNYMEEVNYQSYTSYQSIKPKTKFNNIECDDYVAMNKVTLRAIATSPIDFQDESITSVVPATNNRNIFRSFNCISRQSPSERKAKQSNRKTKSQSGSFFFRLFNRQKTKSKNVSPAFVTKASSKDSKSDSVEDSTLTNADSISNVWSDSAEIECNESLGSFHRESSGCDRVQSCPTPNVNNSTNSETFNPVTETIIDSHNAVFVIE